MKRIPELGPLLPFVDGKWGRPLDAAPPQYQNSDESGDKPDGETAVPRIAVSSPPSTSTGQAHER